MDIQSDALSCMEQFHSSCSKEFQGLTKNCAVHLGTGLVTSERGELELMQHRISECKSVVYGIQSIGSYNIPISPIVASKLYKAE